MATKKSASKKAAKKGSAKKSAKKAGVKLPTVAASSTCIQSCVRAYNRCLQSGTNSIVCHFRLVRCTLRCVRVVTADINKVLKQ